MQPNRQSSRSRVAHASTLALGLIALLVDARPASADEPSQAADLTAPRVLASVRDPGPVVAPANRIERTVAIRANGTMESSERRGTTVTRPVLLATLFQVAIQRLSAQVQALPPSDLEAPNTNVPPCLGVGVAEYAVTKTTGQRLVIAHDLGCGQVLYRRDGRARSLVSLLSAFLTFSKQRMPAATPYPIDGETLARFYRVTAFAPSNSPYTWDTQLDRQGDVINTLTYRDGRVETNPILRVSARTLRAIQLLGQSLPDQEITVPDVPPCLDAPASEIFVHRGSADGGKLVRTWQNKGCITSSLPPVGAVPFFNSFVAGLFWGSQAG